MGEFTKLLDDLEAWGRSRDRPSERPGPVRHRPLDLPRDDGTVAKALSTAVATASECRSSLVQHRRDLAEAQTRALLDKAAAARAAGRISGAQLNVIQMRIGNTLAGLRR